MSIGHLDHICKLIIWQRLFLRPDQLADLCHLLLNIKMKGHERQISQEIKISKPSVNEISPYKFQVFSKNFKKKYQLAQPPSASSSNIARHFMNEKKSETKNSPQKYNSKNKSQRKKSFEKFTIHTRPTQRTSLNIQTTNPQNLSTKSKLMKITNIHCQSAFGGGKKILQQIYKNQDEYEKLIKQWQNLQIFDEVDKLVQKLIQHYCKLIEDILLQTNIMLKQRLEKYQDTIQYLATENDKLKSQLAFYSHLQQSLQPIKERLMSQYQKNQWNTFVFNSLALRTFNIQAFIRQTEVYKRWIAPFVENQPQLCKQQQGSPAKFDKGKARKPQESGKTASKSMGQPMVPPEKH